MKNMNFPETNSIIKVQTLCNKKVKLKRNKHHAPVRSPMMGTGSSSFSVL
jgi:hypothetical protein